MPKSLILVAAVWIILEASTSVAFVNNCARLSERSQQQIWMNTDQVPVNPTSSRQSLLKRSVFGMGSVLSVALLRREKAVAIDLPECSDSVTIFRRESDKREVRCDLFVENFAWYHIAPCFSL